MQMFGTIIQKKIKHYLGEFLKQLLWHVKS